MFRITRVELIEKINNRNDAPENTISDFQKIVNDLIRDWRGKFIYSDMDQTLTADSIEEAEEIFNQIREDLLEDTE
ncbi:hypothetical protein [Fodinibius salsisoli]|uniref:Uncharacterized protein n=1 Tax=Fodinibius salsisoli TaxID=2820877 RepID=A0ABT3PP97_9BACT|nr:hypothetical protein [Fodinibius salsisoli]MCW9707670.1 hypothetical protein [Fodinibius salsisoli]